MAGIIKIAKNIKADDPETKLGGASPQSGFSRYRSYGNKRK